MIPTCWWAAAPSPTRWMRLGQGKKVDGLVVHVVPHRFLSLFPPTYPCSCFSNMEPRGLIRTGVGRGRVDQDCEVGEVGETLSTSHKDQGRCLMRRAVHSRGN